MALSNHGTEMSGAPQPEVKPLVVFSLTPDNILKAFAAFSGLFLFTAYVTGRLYLSAYYGHFSTSINYLDLKPEDIMFESWRTWLPAIAIPILSASLAEITLQIPVLRLPHGKSKILTGVFAMSPLIAIFTALGFKENFTAALWGTLSLVPLWLESLASATAIIMWNRRRIKRSHLVLVPIVGISVILLFPFMSGWARANEVTTTNNEHYGLTSISISSTTALGADWQKQIDGSFISPKLGLLGVGPEFLIAWNRNRPRETLYFPVASLTSIKASQKQLDLQSH